jgi:hypothetical protein
MFNAGYRLKLIQRAAGVPEPAARHLGDFEPASSDERNYYERSGIRDSARGVLVGHGPQRREVRGIARTRHRIGKIKRLLVVHAAKI